MVARKNGEFKTQAILIQSAISSVFGKDGAKAFKDAIGALDEE